MGYDVYDFTESLDRVVLPAEPKRVVAAWGRGGDYAEWEGGFVVELDDGRAAYITGWCDTTGWGCQDGATVVVFTDLAEALAKAEITPPSPYSDAPEATEWDRDPGDLNKALAERLATTKGGQP